MAIVTNVGRDAVDAFGATDERAVADGEAVWFWHPDADAKLATCFRIAPMTVARKPVTGKSAE